MIYIYLLNYDNLTVNKVNLNLKDAILSLKLIYSVVVDSTCDERKFVM